MAEPKPKKVILTEVYSRVVGYLRPVKSWNIGKVQEFAERVDYKAPITTTTKQP